MNMPLSFLYYFFPAELNVSAVLLYSSVGNCAVSASMKHFVCTTVQQAGVTSCARCMLFSVTLMHTFYHDACVESTCHCTFTFFD